ncbi:hypothetical protein K502DRAFT_118566 [Neoconidiobolus thromboides FSU 785]|nr:hypothetical protein K502DRAFT_118566 [Neoconidiobolus thromboides FSU 785]
MYNNNQFQPNQMMNLPGNYNYLHPNIAYQNQNYNGMMNSPIANNFNIPGNMPSNMQNNMQMQNNMMHQVESNNNMQIHNPSMGQIHPNMGAMVNQGYNTEGMQQMQTPHFNNQIPQLNHPQSEQMNRINSAQELREQSHISSQPMQHSHSNPVTSGQPIESPMNSNTVSNDKNEALNQGFKRPAGLRVQIPLKKSKNEESNTQSPSVNTETDVENNVTIDTNKEDVNNVQLKEIQNEVKVNKSIIEPKVEKEAVQIKQEEKKSISQMGMINHCLQAPNLPSPSTFYPGFYQGGEMLSPLVTQTPSTAVNNGAHAFNWPPTNSNQPTIPSKLKNER